MTDTERDEALELAREYLHDTGPTSQAETARVARALLAEHERCDQLRAEVERAKAKEPAASLIKKSIDAQCEADQLRAEVEMVRKDRDQIREVSQRRGLEIVRLRDAIEAEIENCATPNDVNCPHCIRLQRALQGYPTPTPKAREAERGPRPPRVNGICTGCNSGGLCKCD